MTPSASKSMLVSAALALFLGCGGAEKPQELKQVEALWQNPETRKIKDVPGAEKYYREARQFRYDAQEAYQDGSIELAREYAIWSTLRYRTALSIAQGQEAAAALGQTPSQAAAAAAAGPRLASLGQERDKLAREVRELERQVATLTTQRSASLAPAGGDDAKRRAEMVDQKIAQIQSARAAALGVQAERHAPGAFHKAENQLTLVGTLRATTPLPYEALMRAADAAIADFQAASSAARPGYAEAMAKRDPAVRRAALMGEAQEALGAAYVLGEGASVRLIVPGSFAAASPALNAQGTQALSAIAELAGRYDEFSLRIEAYTGKGDATENLGLSQLRAREVEEVLKAAGIGPGRMRSRGLGQDNLRYGTAWQNERVEILFTPSSLPPR